MKKYLVLVLSVLMLGQLGCSSEQATTKPQPPEVSQKNAAMIDGEQLKKLLNGKYSTPEIQKYMADYCQSKGYIVLLDKQTLAKPIQKKDLLDVTTDLAQFIQAQNKP